MGLRYPVGLLLKVEEYSQPCWTFNIQHYTVSYPANLIDSLDDYAIALYATTARQLRQEKVAADNKAKADAERKAELKTLAALSAKYEKS
jgi:hypothetical protein